MAKKSPKKPILNARSIKGSAVLGYGLIFGFLSALLVYFALNIQDEKSPQPALQKEVIFLEEPDPSNSKNTYVRPKPEKNPIGYDEDSRDFSKNYQFPMYASGQQYVSYPITGAPNSFSTAWISSNDEVQICIVRQTNQKDCLPKNEKITRKAGDTEIGWFVVLPDNTRKSWSGSFFINFEDENSVLLKKDEIEYSRMPEPLVFEPDVLLSDKIFSEKENGTRRVMVPLAGRFNSALAWTVDFESGEAGRACVQIRVDSDPICRDKFENIPLHTYAIGYEVNLLAGNYTQDITQLLLGVLSNSSEESEARSDATSTQSYEYTWTVGREITPVVFDPKMNFENQSYDTEKEGIQRTVMQKVQGNFNDELEFSLDWTGQTHLRENSVEICTQKEQSDSIECSQKGSFSQKMEFFAKDIHSIGYRVTLPKEDQTRVEDEIKIVLKSLAGSKEQSKTWHVEQNRDGASYVFHPSMFFENKEYKASLTGFQDPIMKPVLGKFETGFEFSLNWSAQEFLKENDAEICIQAAYESAIECFQQGIYSGGMKFLKNEIYAIGYRINLPENEKIDIKDEIFFSLKEINGQETISWSALQSRPGVPYVFEPSLYFEDQFFDLGKSGFQDPEMVSIEGNFNDKLRFSLDWSSQSHLKEHDVELCLQLSSDGNIRCSQKEAYSGSVEFYKEELVAVGYRVNLPQNNSLEVSDTIAVSLEMIDTKDMMSWSVLQSRPGAPHIFEHSMVFEDQEYEMNHTGFQDPIMSPVDGTFNDRLKFSLDWSSQPHFKDYDVELCVQMSFEGKIECSQEEAYSGNIELYESDLYAIGYRVKLPENKKYEVLDDLTITLEMVNSNEKTSWTAVQRRPGAPYIFDPAMGFESQEYDIDHTGFQEPVMSLVEGNFNDRLRFSLDWSSQSHLKEHNVELCTQLSADQEIECSQKEGYTASLDFFQDDLYAVGYRVKLPENEKLSVSDTLALSLEMIETGESASWMAEQKRTGVPYVFNPSMIFQDQFYEIEATGFQSPIMSLVEGDFNDRLRFSLDWASQSHLEEYDIELCTQISAESEIECSQKGGYFADIEFFKEDLYAVGYRVKFPEQTKLNVSDTLIVSLEMIGAKEIVSWPTVQKRMGVPYVFNPDMVFQDETYDIEAAGFQNPVMKRIEGDFNDELRFSLDWASQSHLKEYDVELCTQASAGSEIECFQKGDYFANIEFFKENLYAVGYRVKLPEQRKLDVSDTLIVSLEMIGTKKIVSWPIAQKRMGIPYIFDPNMKFDDQIYNIEAVGFQDPVMERLEGDFNDRLRFSLDWSSQSHLKDHAVELCTQISADHNIECFQKEEYSASVEFFKENMHAIGYRVKLPQEDKVEVSNTLTLSLKMIETGDMVSWSVAQKRAGVLYTFNPNMDFQDRIYDAEAVGFQDPVMNRVEGDFNDRLRFSLDWSSQSHLKDHDVELCTQLSADQDIECFQKKEYSASVEFLKEDMYAIGYRVKLPKESKIEVLGILTLSLEMIETGDVVSWLAAQKRASVPYIFSPNMVFQDKTYNIKAVGFQDPVMNPVEGDFNDQLRFSLDWSSQSHLKDHAVELCTQVSANHNIECFQKGKYSASVDFFKENLYAIGYRTKLPEDNKVEIFDTLTISLEMIDTEATVSWHVVQRRFGTPYVFEPNISFDDQAYEMGATGAQKPVLVPVSGNFNDTLKFSAKGIDKGNICTQRKQGGKITCTTNALNEGVVFEPNDYYAIGYKIDLPENDKEEFNQSIDLILGLIKTGETISWSVNQSRPAMPYVFEPDMIFEDRIYEMGATGLQNPAMTPISGNFNATLEFSVKTAEEIRICVQKTQETDVFCEKDPPSDRVIFEPREYYAIGYQFALPMDDSLFVEESIEAQIKVLDTNQTMSWYPVQKRVGNLR